MKQAVPFNVLILLCVGLLGGGEGRYCPRCDMKNSENDSCTFQVYAVPSCDCPDSEYAPSISNSDSFQTIANSFQVAINYTSKLDANVIVSWVLPDEDHLSNTTLHLKITYHEPTQTVCLPLANTITMVSARLQFPLKYCRTNNYVDEIFVTLTANGERGGQTHTTLQVYDCFKTMENKSDHICGPRVNVPHAPMSAEATVIGQPPGKTVVKVSWEPPMDGAVPVWYNLDLWCNLPYNRNCKLFLNVPGNSTETIVTINHTLSPSNDAYFKVRGGGYVDGPDCNCLFWQIPQLKQTVFFCNGTNAILQFPDHPQPVNVHLIIWPVLAGVAVVVLVFLLVIYSTRRLRRWMRKRDPSDDSGPLVVDDVMETQEQGTVFLVASTEEDERVRRRIRHLCHVLGNHGLTPVYYEYVVNDHSAGSPSALGMNRWVELQFVRCQFVLFVCTKRFLEEWKGEKSEMPSPLVYPCRNLLDGSIQHPQNNNRYAVLFMGDGHRVPSLLGCFRQFDIFQVESEEIHADGLIHFLLDAPSCVPRVVNFFRHLV